jgi:ubiquinone/menaquinone biosynthesis C-methylase UbiE
MSRFWCKIISKGKIKRSNFCILIVKNVYKLLWGIIIMEEGIFDVKHAQKLDNPERVRDLRPLELLKSVAGVVNGDTCVDFGSGTGMFALPMSELVGSQGKIYAVDRSLEMLDYIRKKHPSENFVLINGDVERTGLDSQIADLCLLAFILHEVKKPDNLLAEAYRLLKSGGKLVIVEWKADSDSPGPPRKLRISKYQIEKLFGQAGLIMENYLDWSTNHYVAVGKKGIK